MGRLTDEQRSAWEEAKAMLVERVKKRMDNLDISFHLKEAWLRIDKNEKGEWVLVIVAPNPCLGILYDWEDELRVSINQAFTKLIPKPQPINLKMLPLDAKYSPPIEELRVFDYPD